MNLFSTAKGLRRAGALISHKNLWSAPSLRQCHFTLKISACSAPQNRAMFLCHKSPSQTPDWLQQHELHQSPQWKKLFRAHSLDNNTAERAKKLWQGQAHLEYLHSHSGPLPESFRKAAALQIRRDTKKPSAAVCDCGRSPHEAQHRQGTGD